MNMSKSNGFVESSHEDVATLVARMGAFIAHQRVFPFVRKKKKKKGKGVK